MEVDDDIVLRGQSDCSRCLIVRCFGRADQHAKEMDYVILTEQFISCK
jgi:hypothetical protein